MHKTLLYHLAGYSTSYSIIIIGFCMPVYEAWKRLEEVKNNIVATIIYAVLLILGIFEILDIQILSLCCLKKKVLQYKILCILKDINQILSYCLDDIKNKELTFPKKLETEFSLLLEKINTIRDFAEKEKNRENPPQIGINNRRNYNRKRKNRRKRNRIEY